MDRDDIGAFCPRCDRELRPGVTECPDCGVALVGADEARAAPEVPRPPALEPALGAAWADRLMLVGAACATAVLLTILGTAVSVWTDDRGQRFGERGFAQHLLQFTRVASPGLALVALAGAVAVTLGRRLPATGPEASAAWAALGACVAVAVLALVGAFETWRDGMSPTGAAAVATYATWLATLTIAATGAAVHGWRGES